jgi:hypothetical protein
MTLSLHLPQISQEDAVRFLHDQGVPAGGIHLCLVDLFWDKAIEYLTVAPTIRQLSWSAPESPKGRPANFYIDTALHKVLNGDSTASECEIAQYAKLSTSTAFYVLPTCVA